MYVYRKIFPTRQFARARAMFLTIRESSNFSSPSSSKYFAICIRVGFTIRVYALTSLL